MRNQRVVNLDRARQAMAEARLDLLLVNSPANVWYLSGYPLALSGLQGRGYGRNASVLLAVDGPPILVPGSFEEQISRARAWVTDIEPFSDYTEIPVAAAAKIAQRRGLKVSRVGVEWDHLSDHFRRALKAALPESTLVPVDMLLDGLRAVKEDAEVVGIEQTYAATAAAAVAALRLILPTDTEIDIHNRLTVAMVRGLWSEKVDGSVLSGDRIALWNGQAGHRKLVQGEWVRLEYTTASAGFAARLCRMGTVGDPQAAQREVYRRFVSGCRAALEAIQPGAAGKAIYESFRLSLAEQSLALLPGSVGFGLGYGPVERPYLTPVEELPIREQMVLSVEPATLEGLRVNWVVVVERQGPRVLQTSFPADELFTVG